MVKGEILSDGIFDEMPPWTKSDTRHEKDALEPTECQEAICQEAAQQNAEKGKTKKKKALMLQSDVHTHLKQASNNGPSGEVHWQSLPSPPSSPSDSGHASDSGPGSSVTSSTLELNSDDDYGNEYITFLHKQPIEILSY